MVSYGKQSARRYRQRRGEVIRVEVGEFKGKKLLHIRTWYTNEAGELAPTKKGVALSYEQFQKFKSILGAVDDIMTNE
jgi:hypothetical protein